MEASIFEERAEFGWVTLPSTCPEHVAKIIGEKRTRMLRKRQHANSAPAAPAVVVQRVSDSERDALAKRISTAIRLF